MSCDTTCCCELSAHFCAMHVATAFGGCWLWPTDWTRAGGWAADAEIATVKAINGKYFTLSPQKSLRIEPGCAGLRKSERSCRSARPNYRKQVVSELFSAANLCEGVA